MESWGRGRVYNVLFLCTGNSARSILAEALLNHWGAKGFKAYSAGSFPTGRVNPLALELLSHMEIPATDARSKSWDELAAPGGLEFDFVITVCDKAAGEVCPIWPGQPMTAHWGVDDPAAVAGSNVEKMLAFRDAFRALEHRIRIFVSLPFASLDRLRLKHRLDEIGREQPAASDASTGA
jgi:arsenate reductase